jgi:hypothetical protein
MKASQNLTPSLETLEYTAKILRKQLREAEKAMKPLRHIAWARKITGMPAAGLPALVARLTITQFTKKGIVKSDLFGKVVQAFEGIDHWPTYREVYHLFNKVGIDWGYERNSPTDLWTADVCGAGLVRPPQNIFVQF